ncbi:MAG: methyltransferase domain-containing protein [Rhodocyclaceae bacterium]|nr:methyltransferase domain-containing protein [Rhodocyclaceae bacterium]
MFGHTKKVYRLRAAIDALRSVRGGGLRILDMGCGSGHAVTRFLAREGDQVIGVDIHAPNIEYANLHYAGTGLRFICRDVATLVADGELFDVVVLADVLEHLDTPADALALAVALTASDGRVLISVPNGFGPFELESALQRVPWLGRGLLTLTDLMVAVLNRTVCAGAWTRAAAVVPADLPYNIDSGHVQFFLQSDMQRLIDAAGLRLLARENLSFLAGPYTNTVFSAWQGFCRWNARVADHLPGWCASAWLFVCTRAT